MNRLCTIALATTLVGAATAADAHARLDHAVPPVGSTVATSPSQITLYFSEALEPKFSGGEVRNAAGARVDHGQSASGKVMHLSVSGLAPGIYTVTWHVLSVDTHKTQGSFNFTVGK
jgi:copper resistance protein C